MPHDWKPFTTNPRFTRCTRCQTTRCEDRQTPGLYWYRIPGVNCGPAHRFNGITAEPPCIDMEESEDPSDDRYDGDPADYYAAQE